MSARRIPKEDRIRSFYNKPKVQNKIICRHCKEFSGWENSELSKILRSADLKCQQCGKVFMTVKINNFRTPSETIEDDFVQKAPKKEPISEKINDDESGNRETEGDFPSEV